MSSMGYIIEVRRSHAIIMTQDGGFTRIKVKPGMIEGILIEYSTEQVITNKWKPAFWFSSVAVAAIVLVILVLSYFQPFYSSIPYMYVDIDINPSLELGLDKSNKIVKYQSLNSDAETLIDKLILDGLNLEEGLKRVLEKSSKHGFITLEKGNVVLISACVNPDIEDKRTADKNIEILLNSITHMDLTTYNSNVKVIKATPEDRKAAKEINISMGRYKLYKKAQDSKIKLSLEQAKNNKVSDILEKVQLSGQETFMHVKGKTPDDKSNVVTTPSRTSRINVQNPSLMVAPSAVQTPANMPKYTLTGKPTVQPTTMRLDSPTPTPAYEEISVLFDGTGLRGEYYDNLDLTALKNTRIDPVIDLRWGISAPPAIKNDGSFSMRWCGKLQPFYSEEYTFYVTGDNGVRLWVDNKLLVDNWDNKSSVTTSAKLVLKAGRKYNIRLEYYNNTGLAVIKLEWSSLSTKREVIPQNCLYPSAETISKPPTLQGDGTGLKGEYFDNSDLKNLKLTEVDPVIEYNWGVGSPDNAIKADSQFSIRWTGKIKPLYSEEYTFYIVYDDGVRLWIDNKLVVDKWTSGPGTGETRKIILEAGKKYDIRLEYTNTSQWGKVKLEWSSLHTNRMVIPQSRLYPS